MGTYTMLVVDDEPDIRQLLRIFFERQGFTIYLANDGKAGIDLAKRHQPDIILMDIQMPFMSGLDAVRYLRTDPSFASTPILALTAYARVNVAADIIRAGFDEALYKPIDFGMLHATVQEAMQRKR